MRAVSSVSEGDGGKAFERTAGVERDRDPCALGDVAAERRAVHAKRAVVAQLRRLGPEVLAIAGALDRRPDRADLALDRAARLIRWRRADLDRVGEVEQLHARRAAAEV